MTPPPEDDASRVFFAVWPDAGVRAMLAALAREYAEQTGGRVPAASNLHLTLAFVGDVVASGITTLREIGSAASAVAAPFTLTLDRVGAFRNAGIVWAGASTLPPELERMVQALNDELASAGFPTERRAFQPHVTLARRCRKLARAELAAPIAWRVESLVLNVSEPCGGGVRYRALAQWPLDGLAAERQ